MLKTEITTKEPNMSAATAATSAPRYVPRGAAAAAPRPTRSSHVPNPAEPSRGTRPRDRVTGAPIDRTAMIDENGYSYNAATVARLVEDSRARGAPLVSPVTGQAISPDRIVPNYQLREASDTMERLEMMINRLEGLVLTSVQELREMRAEAREARLDLRTARVDLEKEKKKLENIQNMNFIQKFSWTFGCMKVDKVINRGVDKITMESMYPKDKLERKS